MTQTAPATAPEAAMDELFRARRTMPCYDAQTFPDRPEIPVTIILAMDMPLSPAGYAIRLGDQPAGLLPPGGLIVADPGARTVVGDLVVNVLDRQALLMSLCREETGVLAGKTETATLSFPDTVGVTAFHKVIALFPAAHLVCL